MNGVRSDRSRNAILAGPFGTFRNGGYARSSSPRSISRSAAQKRHFRDCHFGDLSLFASAGGHKRHAWVKLSKSPCTLVGESPTVFAVEIFARNLTFRRFKSAKICSPPAVYGGACNGPKREVGTGGSVRNVPGTRSSLHRSERSCYLDNSASGGHRAVHTTTRCGLGSLCRSLHGRPRVL